MTRILQRTSHSNCSSISRWSQRSSSHNSDPSEEEPAMSGISTSTSHPAVTESYLHPLVDQQPATGPSRTTTSSGQQNSIHGEEENDSRFSTLIPSHILREIQKEERRLAKLPIFAMKSPMYDNCEMLDPQGKLLAKISKKKAKWYVSKQLATWTHPTEKTQIQIYFEPKGHSSLLACSSVSPISLSSSVSSSSSSSSSSVTVAIQQTTTPLSPIINQENNPTMKDTHSKTHSIAHAYTISKKDNVCVVCGDTKYHIRFYIVPYIFRSLFPSKYKSHMSHDIVIVCGHCHVTCEQYTQRRIKELERICLPAEGYYPPKFINHSDLYNVHTSALALMNWKDKLPMHKIQEYTVLVKNYLDSSHGEKNDHRDPTTTSVCIDSKKNRIKNQSNRHLSVNDSDMDLPIEHLTKEQLQQAIDVEYRVENKDYVSSAEIIIRRLAGTEDQMAEFIRNWRRQFIDNIHPRYMPIGWNVDYPVCCDK